jgi:prepilin-type processing-associated H-X9-DG protein
MAAVGRSRSTVRDVQCRNNLRQFGVAAHLYAHTYDDHLPPLGYWLDYPVRYWWGTNEDPPDYSKGFLSRFMGEAGKTADVYQCPEQPIGSYESEGIAGALTTTYGYNGYFLCPAATPGWAYSIGQKPWQTLSSITCPEQVFMFADTLLDWGGGNYTNSCFLDPPFVIARRSKWTKNSHPTLCFRHSGHANVCFVDGHVEGVQASEGTITAPGANIGYYGKNNDPHYVPRGHVWE